jgi:hypothetical protein
MNHTPTVQRVQAPDGWTSRWEGCCTGCDWHSGVIESSRALAWLDATVHCPDLWGEAA